MGRKPTSPEPVPRQMDDPILHTPEEDAEATEARTQAIKERLDAAEQEHPSLEDLQNP